VRIGRCVLRSAGVWLRTDNEEVNFLSFGALEGAKSRVDIRRLCHRCGAWASTEHSGEGAIG